MNAHAQSGKETPQFSAGQKLNSASLISKRRAISSLPSSGLQSTLFTVIRSFTAWSSAMVRGFVCELFWRAGLCRGHSSA